VLTTVLSLAMVLVPAAAIRRRHRDGVERGTRAVPMAYFAALGLGFLLVEVALVQRFVLVLDHSARSFAVVVFGLLVSSGIGSLFSARLAWRGCLAALVAAIALYPLVLSTALPALLGQSLAVRVAATLVLLAPLGFLMGAPFPRGLASLGAARPTRLPLAWGVNGFTSVISAILAAMIALSWGFGGVFLFATLVYAAALVTAHGASKTSGAVVISPSVPEEQTPRR
jgi:hypothetical protein